VKYENFNILRLIFSPHKSAVKYILKGVTKNTMILGSVLNQLSYFKPKHNFQAHKGRIASVIVLPNGNLVSGGTRDETIKIWDIQTDFKCLKVLKAHRDVRFLVALGNNDILSVLSSYCVIIWVFLSDYTTTLQLYDDGGHLDNPMLLPDGHIAAAARDNTVRIWNIYEFKQIAILKVHTSSINCFLSLNNYQFASGSNDSNILIWDSYNCLHRIKEHKSPVHSLLLLTNGNFASGAYKIVKIWDNLYKCIYTICEVNIVNSMALVDNYTVAQTYDNINIWYSVNNWGNEKPGLFKKAKTVFYEVEG
jgi:WD40 repeat protein